MTIVDAARVERLYSPDDGAGDGAGDVGVPVFQGERRPARPVVMVGMGPVHGATPPSHRRTQWQPPDDTGPGVVGDDGDAGSSAQAQGPVRRLSSLPPGAVGDCGHNNGSDYSSFVPRGVPARRTSSGFAGVVFQEPEAMQGPGQRRNSSQV